MTRGNNLRRPVWLDPFEPPEFPNPADYDRHGLLAVGGDLSPRSLLTAYRAGIFPWYEEPPILWWSPDPRTVIDLGSLHISRSLKRHLRHSSQEAELIVLPTGDISEVMHTAGALRESTWITPEMEQAYTRLGRQGYALAYEVRRAGELVGGLYGVRLGGLFAAESMFHRETDASKVALVCAVVHQFGHGASLFDVQFLTPHLKTMGAYEISRATYLNLLQTATGLADAMPDTTPTASKVAIPGHELTQEATILPWVAARLNLL